MKRLLCVTLILLATVGAFALDFATFESSFQAFSQDFANVLPFNTMIGLNWSDAYIGQLFHLGLGISLGATTIPYDSLVEIGNSLGQPIELPPELQEYVPALGFPIPAYTIDARLGGILLPFDVGVKIGVINAALADKLNVELPFDVEYTLAGADVRFALLKGDFLKLSVGGGVNIMRGRIAMPGLLGSNISIDLPPGLPAPWNTWTVALTDPALDMQWETSVIDLKAQASINLLLLTPYVGAGASLGQSMVGGGVSSALLVNGVPATAQDIADIKAAFESASQPVPDLSAEGILVQAESKRSWAFRAFAGVSLNVLFIKLDLTAMYNLTTQSLGGSAGLRIQF